MFNKRENGKSFSVQLCSIVGQNPAAEFHKNLLQNFLPTSHPSIHPSTHPPTHAWSFSFYYSFIHSFILWVVFSSLFFVFLLKACWLRFNAFEGRFTILGLYQKQYPIKFFKLFRFFDKNPLNHSWIFYPVPTNEYSIFFYFHKTYWHLEFRVHGIWNYNPKFKERILLTKSFGKA